MVAITVSAGAGVKNWDTQNVQMGVFWGRDLRPHSVIGGWG